MLRHLLLSKEQKGKDRGFISYVDLGINQLGAVYEGLMSYTGFFAETDLYEVAKNANAEKGSWVVPVERAHDIAESDFVTTTDPITGETKPVMHDRGTFVFRLSGRERQQSASYYSPEVITRFVVSQALEELLDQDGQRTPARDILDLTVCEPALGSGAFAVEAVRQLAEQYLSRRQEELGERIDPDQYPQELQKVKASIALHQIYGVDLNTQAVEFAEITLWLDSMSKDLQAPWFGLHLRRGNSLIGARHAVYSRDQITSRAWLTIPPTDIPLTGIAEKLRDDTRDIDLGSCIHHFLLPADDWGSTAEAKEAKELVPERVKQIKAWRKSITRKLTTKQLNALEEIAHQVEALWMLAYRRLVVAEQESRRSIKLWGLDEELPGSTVTREQIEESLADEDGAYRRLRRVMDAWCALWFWPLHGKEVWTEDDRPKIDPPSLDEWIDALGQLVGSNKQTRRAAQHGADMLRPDNAWATLAAQEDFEIKGAGARPIAEVKQQHPWLQVCDDVAAEQGFFHWHLDFATIFGSGGFDLQVGNPPWVRPRTDVEALLAEGDPWWQLALKPGEAEKRARRDATLALPGLRDLVLGATTDTVVLAEYTGSVVDYPTLAGLQPDLYRCFMSQTWAHSSMTGIVALVHPESHFTDEKAGRLRRETYARLRRHWQFINELLLYEIDDKRIYGVHIYGTPQGQVQFLSASSIFHPDTVERSLHHSGEGEQPGFKDPSTRTWDLRPHRSRIIHVTEEVLESWHKVLEENGTPIAETRMISTVNTAVADVLTQLARNDRIGSLGLEFSRGWDESIDRRKGRFESRWGAPDSWREVILQGPHLHVATPFFKSPNPTMRNNQDWSLTDLETLPPEALPVTAYKPAGDPAGYDAEYTQWKSGPARNFYRIAWREMAKNSNERTLISAIIPPGPAHVHAVNTFRPTGALELVIAQGLAASLTADLAVRSSVKDHINGGVIRRLPKPREDSPGLRALLLRTLRLNCLTDAYAGLWRELWDDAYATEAWAGGVERPNRPALGAAGPEWSVSSPLRIAEDRRNALVEIDALVALMLGVTADQLCTVYRTQFAVLYGYDHNKYLYDANGREVPNSVLTVWRNKGNRITAEERTATNQAGNTYTYELPFRVLDREADMRQAYAEFERRLAERS
ncbi:DNA methyltransferase [Raineyella fluvialis]|uniref:DNA methyltransferase n=1 Tax=Raineyella fluvialis TaxID=2662261 RepID=UPI001E299F7B|nr:DNA methyltransferase [Raineyella fluvialis]